MFGARGAGAVCTDVAGGWGGGRRGATQHPARLGAHRLHLSAHLVEHVGWQREASERVE